MEEKSFCVCCGNETQNTEQVLNDTVYKCENCIRAYGQCDKCDYQTTCFEEDDAGM